MHAQPLTPLPSFARLLLACSATLWLVACGGTTQGPTSENRDRLPGPSAPSLQLSASLSVVSPNGSATLTWSGNEVSGCTASGGWSGTRPASGSESTGPLTTSRTYTLTCASASGDITRSASVSVASGSNQATGRSVVEIEDMSGVAASDVPVTFGHVFRPGDVPAGQTLAAKLGSGAALPIQTDAKAYHADGSLRHAVVTTVLPGLPAGGKHSVELYADGPAAAGIPVSAGGLLATPFDAVVSLDIGGTVYRASARELLQADASRAWLSGPVVSEWMLAAPVRTASGTLHPHLTARFNVRAYAGFERVRVDVIVENTWAYEPSPSNITYDATITVGGTPVYTRSSLTHYRQARWRKVYWWGAEPNVHVRHDSAYLLASGAVPNYDLSLTIPETALAQMGTEWSGAKTEPMGLGLVYNYFPETGARRDIGPLPQWAVRYLLSMDPRAKTATLGTGDAAGTFDIHYRDRTTDLPVSLIDHPYMSIVSGNTYDPVRRVDDAFPACGGGCSTPYTVDSAHQPSLAYLPYLVTGDYYYLEELQFWANWNIFQGNPDPAYRDHEKGLVRWEQGRGQAWSLRTLAHAAYATPDAHPMKQYFVDRVSYNLDFYNNAYTYNANAPLLGFTTSGYSLFSDGTISPWNDDAITMVAGFLADMGFAQAIPFRDWKAKFVHGRFNNDPTFCRHDAVAYRFTVQSSGAFIGTWGDLLAASFPSHVGNCPTWFSSGNPGDPESYLAIAQGALAAAAAAGYPGARAHLDYVRQSLVDAGADFTLDPHWAIVAR